MLCGPGLRFDWLPNPPQLTTYLLSAGPPHGFGKHLDQVSAQDFETFEVVLRSISPATSLLYRADPFPILTGQLHLQPLL